MGWAEQPLAFDTTLHLGTALALIIYFFKDLVILVKAFVKDVLKNKFNFKSFSPDGKFGLKIILASLPAGILGFLLSDFLDNTFRGVASVAVFLLLGSILMIFAEYRYKVTQKKDNPTFLDSLFVGFFQSLALLPGFSRSGASISGGMLLGLNRENAAKFSFILSIPVILAAGGSQLLHLRHDPLGLTAAPLLVGFLVSAITGYIAVDFLIKFLKSKSLLPFIIYRIVLFLILIGFVIFK